MNTARETLAKLTAVTAAAAALLGVSLAPAQPAFAASFVSITGAGSTWSANAIFNWDTNVAALGMTVNYQPVGSVSGMQEFAEGTVDWGASEIPYGVRAGSTYYAPPPRGYTYIPDTAGGIAFPYNLHIGGQRVTNLRLSGPVIAGIFTNQITAWNDPKIAADNPGLTLPAEPIIPLVRSDVSGSTLAFTQWMVGTQSSSWTAYCAVVSISPCVAALAYPVQAGTAMVGMSGDLGVSGYVSQATAEGAIGYTEYAYALQTGFPVAKVLNAAGYYTAPTPDNIGLSLQQAQVINNVSDPLNQTEVLSNVYTDTDPRTYELSYYSYMILPTDLTSPMSTAKGDALGAFGQYLLCQGQQQVDALGYAALPINLVEDGYAQLQRVPGNAATSALSTFLQGCSNPTLSNGSDILNSNAPVPPACDQQGPTQCTGPTTGGGATATTLSANPDPAIVGQSVTLTAIVSAADGSNPPGTVQFEVAGSDIGPAVQVTAGNLFSEAITSTTFDAPGTEALSAVFTPSSIAYSGSTGTLSLTSGPRQAGGVFISVTLPPSGALTVTVGAGSVTLTEQSTTATGTLNDVTVADTRNTYPGWSVSAQDTAFTGSGTAAGSTIPGDDLGWTPGGTVSGGATLGPMVVPGASPGLQDAAQVLASAAPGSGVGTDSLSAALTLDIPAATSAGPYTSSLTITYLLTGP